jgi:hypothetical protein
MPTYLVERYMPHGSEHRLRADAARMERAAIGMFETSHTVVVLEAALLPEDDVALFLVEASDRGDVERLCRRAGVDIDRLMRTELARIEGDPRFAGRAWTPSPNTKE